jgi:flotillin
VLPVFHSTAFVNLKTLRLEVRRGEMDALITKDRMRVDIGAEFYVRVRPNSDSIALAAQTLGDRTNDADQLRQLIEAKFVDALRSVAATMSLNDLQEQRSAFVKAVQETVAADLTSNGLELESVSLTRLDQTDIKFFNPNNSFDAEGLATLTRITEARKKERNEVVRDTEVAIAQKDLSAREQTLTIERARAEAELNQRRDIANASAATRAETAQKEAEARRAEEEARIAVEQASRSARPRPSARARPPTWRPPGRSSRRRSRPSATCRSSARRAPSPSRTRAARNRRPRRGRREARRWRSPPRRRSPPPSRWRWPSARSASP